MSQIPSSIDASSPEALFSLFFTETVLDLIVQSTNSHAKRVRECHIVPRADNPRFDDSFDQEPWKPVTPDEILAFLGMVIYMRLHVEPHIDDYWNTNQNDGPIHLGILRGTVSQTRWKQINRYLHIWNPSPSGESSRPHEKEDHLSALLLSSFQRYWKPAMNLSIAECIEGFIGRTAEIESDEEPLDDGLIDPPTSDPQIQQTISLIEEVTQDLHRNSGMSETLTQLKTKWSNHIAWGRLYGCLSPDQKVLQLAWKDAQIILFMTTLTEARTTVSRVRKKPNKKDRWIREALGNQSFKPLGILDFIDLYNHLMNSVDRTDQIYTYYRTWRLLWNYLLRTTIRIAALIWIDQGHSTEKGGGHLKFRTKLASQLMAHSSSSKHAPPVDGIEVRTNLQSHIVKGVTGCHGSQEVISQTAKACKACRAKGRTAQAGTKRKMLHDLSINSVRISNNEDRSRRPRPPRTKYGCTVCRIHLCLGGSCWDEHIQMNDNKN
jgi:hypothetical protein